MHALPAQCLLCRSPIDSELEQVFDTRFGIDASYTIGCCTQCGLEQTYPVPGEVELKNLYEAHYNYGGEKKTRYTHLRSRILTSRPYRTWLAIDCDISFWTPRGSGRLLDVGCNEG